MIHSLDLTNFRNFESLSISFTHDTGDIRINFDKVWPKVFISGANGVGKTTIREALCFAFTGRDSIGNPTPTHLIGDYSDRTKVSVVSSRGTISRTLTKKKNTTAKWSAPQGDVPFVIDKPSEFETSMLANGVSNEVYLSTTVVGYFMSLPTAKRQQIFSKILPSIDRYAHVAAKCDVDVEFVRKHCKLEKNNLDQNEFTEKRRKTQTAIQKNLGQASYLEGILSNPPQPPEQVGAIRQISTAESNYDAHRKYFDAQEEYISDMAAYKSAVEHNKVSEQLRQDLRKKIDEASTKYQMTYPIESLQLELEELKSKLKNEPQEPSFFSLPEEDNCPTCGQVVRSKHRESISVMNEEKKSAYYREVDEIRQYNESIEKNLELKKAELQELICKNSAIARNNSAIDTLINTLERQLLLTREVSIPQQPMEPKPPECPYVGTKDLIRMREEINQYNRDLGSYRKAMESTNHAKQTLTEIEEENEQLRKQLSDYTKLEWAIRNLVNDELELNKKYLQTSDYDIDTTDGAFFVTNKRGVPYGCMSTGERMLFDLRLCFKFRSFLQNPPMYIFLDDSDLADWVDRMWNNTTMKKGQLFITHVNEGPLYVSDTVS